MVENHRSEIGAGAEPTPKQLKVVCDNMVENHRIKANTKVSLSSTPEHMRACEQQLKESRNQVSRGDDEGA